MARKRWETQPGRDAGSGGRAGGRAGRETRGQQGNGELPPDRHRGRGRESRPRLTFRLPRRQRSLGALTPEQLQGREPGSRGAHHSSGHEAAEKAPRATETGGKTSGSHRRRGLGLWRTRTPLCCLRANHNLGTETRRRNRRLPRRRAGPRMRTRALARSPRRASRAPWRRIRRPKRIPRRPWST